MLKSRSLQDFLVSVSKRLNSRKKVEKVSF